MATETRRYEDGAVFREGLSGWCCARCGRYWGSYEHMARYCCSTDFPCACGARTSKGWTTCPSCRSKKQIERFEAAPKIPYDGEPVFVWDDDKLLFNEDELSEWMYERVTDGVSFEDIRLQEAEPIRHRHFDLHGHLEDSLHEDSGEPDGWQEIEKAVNDWIDNLPTLSWTTSRNAIDPESVRSIWDQCVKDAIENGDRATEPPSYSDGTVSISFIKSEEDNDAS